MQKIKFVTTKVNWVIKVSN